MESVFVDDCTSDKYIDKNKKGDKLVALDDTNFLNESSECDDNFAVIASKKALESNSYKTVNNLSDSSSTEGKIRRKRKLLDELKSMTDKKNGSTTVQDGKQSSKNSLCCERPGKMNNIDDRVSGRENLLNPADNSINISIQSKRGRKKKNSDLSDRSTSENTSEDVHSSPGGILVTKSNVEKNLICNIKSEPIEDLHMSCDEIDASSELSKRTSDVIPVVKRGRGRPKKVPFSIYGHQSNCNKTAGYERQNIKVNSKANDEVKSGSSSTSSEHHRGVVKRGRGRPRKSDSLDHVTVKPSRLSERNSSERHSFPLGRQSVHHSGPKRKIVKPKRFEPYESFDFMDVIDRNTISSNDTSREDRDDDSDALQIVEEEDEEEERDEELDNSNQHQDEGDADLKSKQKKSRVGKRRKKFSLLPSVTCGVCNERMTQKEYEMKHIDKHNFFCWLEGEKPLDPNNENDYVIVYCKLRKLRKKLFTGMKCQKCGIRKKSGVGYFSHTQQCGMSQVEKEAIKIPCTICGRVMLPASLKVHMGQEHKKSETKVVPLNPEEEIIPLTKRQAAKRAESKLEEVLAEELLDESGFSKKVMALKRLYRRTQSRLFPSAYLRWKLELEKNNEAKCFVPGCSFTADNVKTMQFHFPQCPYAVRVFVCKVCGVKMKTEIDMHKHILREHKDHRFGDSDFKMNVNSENEDEVEDVVEVGAVNIPGGPRLIQDKPNFVVQAMRKKGLTFFIDLFERNYKRYLENSSSEPLFEEFIAPVDDVIKEEDAQKYLPKEKESMNFSSENSNWRKLGCFKACIFNESKLMFVGGPIWALSWCPLPLEERRQFLAVATHPDMNLIHSLGTVHAYNSLIQIWDCGELENMNSIQDDSLPKLKVCIGHSHGAVWSLEWCPNCCYEPSAGRLGLLAAGFSDGKAAVYSISSRSISTDRLPILESKPVLELELVSEDPAQCTKVAWSKMPPFDLVACGYSDGLVAVFNLTSQSPILRFENRLNPFLMIQAHVKNITGLHFLPKEGNNLILTAAADRDIKFWNLQDTSGPVSVSQLYRMITVSDIVWLNHWLCAASTYDDALGYGLINVALNGYRDFMFGQPYPLMSQNCLNWSISANDWTNALVTSSDGGEVTLLYSKQLFCLDEKGNKRSKRYLTTTDLYKLDGNDNNDPNTKLKVPQSYEEASEFYGLVLKTKHYDESPSSRREEVDRNFYQIKSVNKVSWNPNGRSFLYLAAGYQAGFVQLFRDRNLDYAKSVFENFYEKINPENI